MKRLRLATLAAIGSLAAAPAAYGAVTIDAGTNSPFAGTYITFDNATLGSTTQGVGGGVTVSFTGNGAFVRGQLPGSYAEPVVTNNNGFVFGNPNGTDTTTYVSAGTGTVTLNLSSPANYVGLLWGSIDAYNTIAITTADGLITSFNGGQTGFAGQSRYVNIFSTTSLITSVVASSGAPSFEFDNLAVGFVPEPTGWALMITGVCLIGGALRRRRADLVYAAA